MIHPQRLCQLELHSENLQDSIRFFSEIFGWPPVPIAIHEYTVLAVPEDCPFGISIVGHLPQEHHPYSSGVIPYFAVEGELPAILEKVERLGGKQVWGPRPMPGYGQLYCVEDPGGIRIGIHAKNSATPG